MMIPISVSRPRNLKMHGATVEMAEDFDNSDNEAVSINGDEDNMDVDRNSNRTVPVGAIISNNDDIEVCSMPVDPPNNEYPLTTPSSDVVARTVIQLDEADADEGRRKEINLLSMGKKLLDSCKDGDANLVKQLMMDGAPFIADWVGTTPLHYSVMNKHVEVTELLLKAGICRDAKNKVDRTPLHVAAHMGLPAMVKILLTYGAEVNCRDMLNMTPLHWVAEHGDLLTTRILLDYGADTSIINKFGKTPLDLAFKNHHVDVTRSIQDADKLHPDVRMIKVAHLKQKLLGSNKVMKTVAEILEPTIEQRKLKTIQMKKKVILVAKENDETGVSKGTLEFASDVNSDSESEQNIDADGPMSTDSAIKLLKAHGVTMIEPDNDTVVSSAVLNGHTIRLTDAGKLAFKSLDSSTNNLPSSDSHKLFKSKLSTDGFLKSDLSSVDPEASPSPAKLARLLPNGQFLHKVSAQQLIEMKKENKIIIRRAVASNTTLPQCTVNVPTSGNNSASDYIPLAKSKKNSLVILHRLEARAADCRRQMDTLKKHLWYKEQEHIRLKKEIEVYKRLSFSK